MTFQSATVITPDPSTMASTCAFIVSNTCSVTFFYISNDVFSYFFYIKKPLLTYKKRFGYTSPLFLSISHYCWNWHSTVKVCCRGFEGPVPPPLWIRIHLLLICKYNYTV